MIKKLEGFLKKKMVEKVSKKGMELGNELSSDYKLMIDDIIKNNYELSSEVKELISFYKDKVDKFCNEYNLEGVEIFNRVLVACLHQGYIKCMEGKEYDDSVHIMKASSKIFEYVGLSKEDDPLYIQNTLSRFKEFMNSNSLISPIRKFIYKNDVFPALDDLYNDKSHNEAKVKDIEKVYEKMDEYRYKDFLGSDFISRIENIVRLKKYFKGISIKYAFFITIVGLDMKDLYNKGANINELYQKLSISTYTIGKVEEKSKNKESLLDLTLYSNELIDLVDICRILSKGEYNYDFLYVSFIENTIDGGKRSGLSMEKYEILKFSKTISYKDMTKYINDNINKDIYPKMVEFSEITPTVILAKMIAEYCVIDTVVALKKIPTLIKNIIPYLSANVSALFMTYDFCKNSADYFKLQMMGRVLYLLLLYVFIKEKEVIKDVISNSKDDTKYLDDKIGSNIANFLNDGIDDSDKKDTDVFDALNIYIDKLSDYVNTNIDDIDFMNLNLCREFSSLLTCTNMGNIDLDIKEGE